MLINFSNLMQDAQRYMLLTLMFIKSIKPSLISVAHINSIFIFAYLS